ncbi:MAG: hypothetical protein Q8P67_22600, partial [archaeon]|nr:hypothetical protein [archaeon]
HPHPHPNPTQSQPVHIHPTDLHKHQSASQIARSPVSISPPVATNTSFVGGSPSEYQLPPRSWEVHAPPSLIVPDNPFVPRPSDRDPKITSLFTTLNFAGREAPPAPVQLKLFEAPDIVPLSLSATPLRALPDEDDPFFDTSPELCFATQAAHPEAEPNHSETPLSFLHSCTVPALNFAPTELPSLAEIAQIFEPSLDLVTGGSGSEGFEARVS